MEYWIIFLVTAIIALLFLDNKQENFLFPYYYYPYHHYYPRSSRYRHPYRRYRRRYWYPWW